MIVNPSNNPFVFSFDFNSIYPDSWVSNLELYSGNFVNLVDQWTSSKIKGGFVTSFSLPRLWAVKSARIWLTANNNNG